MPQNHDHGTLLPQETNFDNADQPGIAQPVSQTELEELLYGDDRPVEERLSRLKEMREELAVRESGDWGDEDPAALLEEVDRAILALEADVDEADEAEDYAPLSSVLDRNPDDHLDALSPDDVDAREALEGEEDAEDLDVLDESEWEEGDEFRPDRGVQ